MALDQRGPPAVQRPAGPSGSPVGAETGRAETGRRGPPVAIEHDNAVVRYRLWVLTREQRHLRFQMRGEGEDLQGVGQFPLLIGIERFMLTLVDKSDFRQRAADTFGVDRESPRLGAAVLSNEDYVFRHVR